MGSKSEGCSNEIPINQRQENKVKKGNKEDNLLVPNKFPDEDAALKGFAKLCQELWTRSNHSEESTPRSEPSKEESKTSTLTKTKKKEQSNKSKQFDNATKKLVKGNSQVKNLAPRNGSLVKVTKEIKQINNNLPDSSSSMNDVSFGIPIEVIIGNDIKPKDKLALRELAKDVTQSPKARKKVN